MYISAVGWRRKLKLKAQVESDSSCFSVQRLVPGALNVGLIGSTCTKLPWGGRQCVGVGGVRTP